MCEFEILTLKKRNMVIGVTPIIKDFIGDFPVIIIKRENLNKNSWETLQDAYCVDVLSKDELMTTAFNLEFLTREMKKVGVEVEIQKVEFEIL